MGALERSGRRGKWELLIVLTQVLPVNSMSSNYDASSAPKMNVMKPWHTPIVAM
ncbi:Uncharacterised protein [Mycobacteroides abscessus subsp. abscessus]|nr:Uncharacterised protein [Mycobacteroides abscessus subsp. abscessus]